MANEDKTKKKKNATVSSVEATEAPIDTAKECECDVGVGDIGVEETQTKPETTESDTKETSKAPEVVAKVDIVANEAHTKVTPENYAEMCVKNPTHPEIRRIRGGF